MGKIAAREAVQAINADLKAKAAAIREAHAKENEVSGSIATEIKALDAKAIAAASAYADLQVSVTSERNTLVADLKYAKEVIGQDKVNMQKELADAKDKSAGAAGGYQGLKNRAISAEADKVALKGEIGCVGEEITRLDKAATRLLREKHEMWQSISELQKRITDDLHRSAKLASEGFEVSGEEAALLKLYFKMQHYVNYRLAKRS